MALGMARFGQGMVLGMALGMAREWLGNGLRYGYGWQGISLGMARFGKGMALGNG
jgi:hypothetical protein